MDPLNDTPLQINQQFLSWFSAMIEWIWTILAAAGVIINVRGLGNANGDIEVLRFSNRNGAYLIQARMNLLRERDRLIRQGIALALGVIALLTPNPIRESISLFGVVIAFAFITFEFLSVNEARRDGKYRAIIRDELLFAKNKENAA